MAAHDPRAPVIVGAGQISDRSGSLSPPQLMAEAARRAAADTGVDPLGAVRAVAAVDCISWPAGDPGRAVAGELGVAAERTLRSVIGGNGPLALLGELCASIQAGDLDAGLLVGGEAFGTLMRRARAGEPAGWPDPPAGAPDQLVGDEANPSHPAESAAGLVAPIVYYPLFETAVRAQLGLDRDDHVARVARLWARFAEVAASNPHAWATEFPGAEEIAAVGPDNRMACFPYRKLMTANIQVDQGAALVVCSAAQAEALGIARERWVFVEAVATAQDHWHVAERESLARSPALAACAAAALEHAGAGIDDVARFDLYSCFPSAVQIAATELGVDVLGDPRPPTVTGGLTFAGGPGNDYATHSLAVMAQDLRGDGGGHGLVTGVGWYMSKHALAVLSPQPPTRPFRAISAQAAVDGLPRREIAAHEPARGAVEAYTVTYDRAGNPTLGIVSCLLEDGRRGFARTDDDTEIAQLLAGDPLARQVRLDGSAGFALA